MREKLPEGGVWLIATPSNGEEVEYLGELSAQEGFFTAAVYRERKAG